MFKRILLCVTSFSCLLHLQAQDLSSQTTETEAQILAAFEKEMLFQIQEAERRVKELQDALASNEVCHTYDMVAQYKNAVRMLDVKKTLVCNFTGAPCLRSALVRETLLDILKKDIIMASDLAYLQTVVNSEKARMS